MQLIHASHYYGVRVSSGYCGYRGYSRGTVVIMEVFGIMIKPRKFSYVRKSEATMDLKTVRTIR